MFQLSNSLCNCTWPSHIEELLMDFGSLHFKACLLEKSTEIKGFGLFISVLVLIIQKNVLFCNKTSKEILFNSFLSWLINKHKNHSWNLRHVLLPQLLMWACYQAEFLFCSTRAANSPRAGSTATAVIWAPFTMGCSLCAPAFHHVPEQKPATVMADGDGLTWTD